MRRSSAMCRAVPSKGIEFLRETKLDALHAIGSETNLRDLRFFSNDTIRYRLRAAR